MSFEKQIEVRNLRLCFGPKEVLHGISFDIRPNEIFGIIGPAQSGKTSLLRCINRTIDFSPEARVTGSIKVGGRLDSLGTKLSGGQQQRLTIARALSHQPEILCLDEFSIAIDPVTTMRIEDVLKELRRQMTIILVTNLTQQARRLAARTLFLWNGEIIELDRSEVIFSDRPGNQKTYDYVNGIFG
jgi:ABC-type phosphate transport system ATPase subunit